MAATTTTTTQSPPKKTLVITIPAYHEWLTKELGASELVVVCKDDERSFVIPPGVERVLFVGQCSRLVAGISIAIPGSFEYESNDIAPGCPRVFGWLREFVPGRWTGGHALGAWPPERLGVMGMTSKDAANCDTTRILLMAHACKLPFAALYIATEEEPHEGSGHRYLPKDDTVQPTTEALALLQAVLIRNEKVESPPLRYELTAEEKERLMQMYDRMLCTGSLW